MAKLMTVDELIVIARRGGINLERDVDESRENLYVYADPEGNVLYIGRAASHVRGRNEVRIAEEGYTERLGVGFSALITENNATRHRFRYEPESFDPKSILQEENQWSGRAITPVLERLNNGEAPTIAEVEQILVRIVVCTGRLIGNSQYASQWEGPAGKFENVIAVLAAFYAREHGDLPRGTALDAPDAAEAPAVTAGSH